MSHKGHIPRKRFGQNFLTDQHVIERICGAIHPTASDNLVEIGPGLGALTQHLLNACHKIHAVELDRDLIPRLQANVALDGELIVHQADALKFDFASLSRDQKIRVVGNLPYNISTPLIFHLLGQTDQIADMHFMLQKEVVERLCAEPGTKHYGRLSIMVQYHAQTEYLFTVKPGAFNPAPKVDSAIVRITPHPTPPFPCDDIKQLQLVVTSAFNARRKSIRNGLKKLSGEHQLIDAGIDPAERPEQISIKQFVALANLLGQQGQGER